MNPEDRSTGRWSPLSVVLVAIATACSPPATGGDAGPVDATAADGGDASLVDASNFLFRHCTRDADCGGSGLVCSALWGGGLCTRSCSTDRVCGTNGRCLAGLPTSSSLQVCAPRCDGDTANCDAYGGACAALSLNASGDITSAACFPTCFQRGASNRPDGFPDCPTGTTCEAWATVCTMQPLNLSGRDVGEPCTAASQCKTGHCFQSVGNGGPTGYLGGYCYATARRPDEASADRTSNCPPGSAIIPVTGMNFAGGVAYCFKDCARDQDCRGGYRCAIAQGATRGLCRPIDCATAACPSGATCVDVTSSSGRNSKVCTESDVDGGTPDSGTDASSD